MSGFSGFRFTLPRKVHIARDLEAVATASTVYVVVDDGSFVHRTFPLRMRDSCGRMSDDGDGEVRAVREAIARIFAAEFESVLPEARIEHAGSVWDLPRERDTSAVWLRVRFRTIVNEEGEAMADVRTVDFLPWHADLPEELREEYHDTPLPHIPNVFISGSLWDGGLRQRIPLGALVEMRHAPFDRSKIRGVLDVPKWAAAMRMWAAVRGRDMASRLEVAIGARDLRASCREPASHASMRGVLFSLPRRALDVGSRWIQTSLGRTLLIILGVAIVASQSGTLKAGLSE